MRIIAVASGKGGVGKSTVSYLLARGLEKDSRVLLLDFDLCGPSIGLLMGHTTEKVFMKEKGFQPIHKEGSLYYLSISSMIPSDSAVVWRGPKKISLLKMFLESASSDEYDYVIIDMPPGITDEHIFLCESSPAAEVLVVTTSQNMALDEAAETVRTFQREGVDVIGIVENMQKMVCPNCSNCISIFSREGGKILADDLSVPYLGHIDYITNIEDTGYIPESVILSIKNQKYSD